jgi:hypothetical protein
MPWLHCEFEIVELDLFDSVNFTSENCLTFRLQSIFLSRFLLVTGSLHFFLGALAIAQII